MKKTVAILLSTILGIFFIGFTSCKKESSTADKMNGQWFVKELKIKTIEEEHVSSYEPQLSDADYFSFKKDNNTYIRSISGAISSGSYTILSDTRFLLNKDTAIIHNLTNKEFSFKLISKTFDQIIESDYLLQLK